VTQQKCAFFFAESAWMGCSVNSSKTNLTYCRLRPVGNLPELVNPLLDELTEHPSRRFSEEESAFLWVNISMHVPVELFAFRVVLSIIQAGDNTPELVNERLKGSGGRTAGRTGTMIPGHAKEWCPRANGGPRPCHSREASDAADVPVDRQGESISGKGRHHENRGKGWGPPCQSLGWTTRGSVTVFSKLSRSGRHGGPDRTGLMDPKYWSRLAASRTTLHRQQPQQDPTGAAVEKGHQLHRCASYERVLHQKDRPGLVTGPANDDLGR